ncbi:GCN5-related N-acetyltransferase [Devosia sp. LC5]|uniref:GNAT family N-acetyltransferase n=1 Tax=Devosia sp. LC5 TaxID=1502724 RepID=UPI0004E2FCC6|nr:GNAT family N-acetyltransferase [Devosia sp. LC5]KFC61731.1 GCN5-related N-acetyltransferase [Devosia sp. LC5]
MTRLVRNAVPADAARLLDLIRQHAAFEGASATLDEDDIVFVLHQADPPIRLIVAEEHGALSGYAAFTFDYALWSASRFAYLDCLFVRADARGRGVGKRLFDHACHLSDGAGVHRIEWQTPAWNADAIRFYEREGAAGQSKMRFTKIISTTLATGQGPDSPI